MKITTLFLAVLTTASLAFVSCNEQENANVTVKYQSPASNTQMQIQNQTVTRDLSLLTAINVEIIGCQISYPTGWVNLAVVPGIYNLMDVDSDATVILVDHYDIPGGHANQMRLLLGDNNTLVIDGQTYPLKVPSGEQTGLKINLNHDTHFINDIDVVLALDPEQSIVELGSGGYILKPVIKVDVINLN